MSYKLCVVFWSLERPSFSGAFSSSSQMGVLFVKDGGARVRAGPSHSGKAYKLESKPEKEPRGY